MHAWSSCWHAGRVMTSRTGYGRIVLLLLAAGVSVASVRANAQPVPATESQSSDKSGSPDTAPDTPSMEADAAATADDSDIKDLELDWSQLNVDASTLTTSPASKARVAPKAGTAENMTWSSLDNPNGSSALSVKQPLSPFWDTRVGADMTVVRQPTTMSELLSEKVANGGSEPQSSGSAWAAITAPGVCDLGQDRGRGPCRSLPGAKQARHLSQQIGVPQRAIFGHAAE